MFVHSCLCVVTDNGVDDDDMCVGGGELELL